MKTKVFADVIIRQAINGVIVENHYPPSSAPSVSSEVMVFTDFEELTDFLRKVILNDNKIDDSYSNIKI